MLIHTSSEDNSVYFQLDSSRKEKNSLHPEHYLLIYLIEKERGLKKSSFENTVSFTRRRRFFLKIIYNDFPCTHSRALKAEKKIRKTRETGSRPGFFFFFFQIKTELFFLVTELAEISCLDIFAANLNPVL